MLNSEENNNILPSHLIRSSELGSFLEGSKINYPLLHITRDVSGVVSKGFNFSLRGTGLNSTQIEPVGISLIDTSGKEGYMNPFEVNDKIENILSNSGAGIIHIAAQLNKNVLNLDTYSDLWQSEFYKKAVLACGHDHHSGDFAASTGDYIIDPENFMLPDGSLNRIEPSLLKQKLTEELIRENYNALTIAELSEVLVLSTSCLKIITDIGGQPIVSRNFHDALEISYDLMPNYTPGTTTPLGGS